LKSKVLNIISNKKLENTILSIVFLLALKLLFPLAESFLPKIMIGSVTLIVAGFAFLFFEEKIKTKKEDPLDLIKYLVMLAGFVFLLLLIQNLTLSEKQAYFFHNNIITSIIINLELIFLLLCYVFFLVVFKLLFFLRQKKKPEKYFKAKLYFVIAASILSLIASSITQINFIKYAFYYVALLLILINSFRVAWIAFLLKKQKLVLLGGSILLAIIFSSTSASFYNKSNFSLVALDLFLPGMRVFIDLISQYGSFYFTIIFFTTLFHIPTASVFDRKAEELSSLLDLSNLVTQVFDFKELAENVTETTIRVCNASAAWLIVKINDNYEIISVKNIGFIDAEEISNFILKSDSIKENNVLVFNRDFWLDIKAKPKFNTFVVAPLKVHEEYSGYLFAARLNDINFDEEDQKTILSYADFAAVTFENAKLIKESIEKERMEKELDLAREIQHKIIPVKTPQTNKLKTSALFVPAFEVGGDYYDFFDLGENKLGFVIADVSGKGISSAFIMAEVKGVFESLADLIDSPKELLIKANKILEKSLDKKSFVTAIYGVFDLLNNKLSFARAGHPPLILLRDGEILKYQPKGLGLGFRFFELFEKNIVEESIDLMENDLIVIYTDGITEAKNEELQDYGEDRLEYKIKESSEKNIDDIGEKILESVSIYSQNIPQHDDITLVLFKWTINSDSQNNFDFQKTKSEITA